MSIEALREIALKPAIEEGTTVRFKVTYGPPDLPRVYSFVAVLLSGFWYSTAQTVNSLEDGSAVRPKMSQYHFAGVLRSPQVSEIQVATAWERL